MTPIRDSKKKCIEENMEKIRCKKGDTSRLYSRRRREDDDTSEDEDNK